MYPYAYVRHEYWSRAHAHTYVPYMGTFTRSRVNGCERMSMCECVYINSPAARCVITIDCNFTKDIALSTTLAGSHS